MYLYYDTLNFIGRMVRDFLILVLLSSLVITAYCNQFIALGIHVCV